MTALYIILGIVLFFIVLFSFKVSVIIEMTDKNKVTIKYLFLKFTLVDSSKPPKEKKSGKEKQKEKEEAFVKKQKEKEEAAKQKKKEKTAEKIFNKTIGRATSSAFGAIGRQIGNSIIRGLFGTSK